MSKKVYSVIMLAGGIKLTFSRITTGPNGNHDLILAFIMANKATLAEKGVSF